MKSYRKKPLVIKARQVPLEQPPHKREEMRQVMECCGKPYGDHEWIKTLEGTLRACPGDWIITGVKGEQYPCKPDIFEATYEEVVEE